MIVDTQQFLAASAGHHSYLYLNWGEIENEGMQQSAAVMRKLLDEKAPKGLRWTIEQARGADHQATPLAAIEPALRGLFRVDTANSQAKP